MLSRRTLVDTLAITTAITGTVLGATSGLYGMKALVVEANFTYGSSGTTTKIWVQTSLDGGSNWIDIMNFAFTTSSARKVRTATLTGLVALRENIVVTDATLSDNLMIDGVLGDMIRAKITTTGTYAGSTALTVNMIPKGA